MNHKFNKWLLAVAALISFSFLQPAPATAGPVSCASAIIGCTQGGKKVAKSIKASRKACKALRDCKKVCRVTKKVTRKDNKKTKKACLKTCKKKRGKAKRKCKRACRKTKRHANKDNRQDKRACIKQCRKDYKTPACRSARKSMVKTIVKEGLKCAPKVVASCAPTPTP